MSRFTTRPQGLTYRGMKNFTALIVKANQQQLRVMRHHIITEIEKRDA